VFAFITKNRLRLISFGIIWFFIALLVESSIIPIGNVIFEHRVYLPMVGFSLFFSVLLAAFITDNKKYMVVFGIVVLTLGFLTYQRNTVWQTEITLWSDVSKKSPFKPRPANSLGYAYLEDGKLDKALNQFNRALTLAPHYVDALNNRGRTFARMGEYRKALQDYSRSIELNPFYIKAYNNRGNILSYQGENDSAIVDFSNALFLEPDFAEAYINRGLVYEKQRKYELALNDFNKAIDLNPNISEAYNNRGILYIKTGKTEQAVSDFKKAIQLKPSFTTAIRNLNHILQNSQKD